MIAQRGLQQEKQQIQVHEQEKSADKSFKLVLSREETDQKASDRTAETENRSLSRNVAYEQWRENLHRNHYDGMVNSMSLQTGMFLHQFTNSVNKALHKENCTCTPNFTSEELFSKSNPALFGHAASRDNSKKNPSFLPALTKSPPIKQLHLHPVAPDEKTPLLAHVNRHLDLDLDLSYREEKENSKATESLPKIMEIVDREGNCWNIQQESLTRRGRAKKAARVRRLMTRPQAGEQNSDYRRSTVAETKKAKIDGTDNSAAISAVMESNSSDSETVKLPTIVHKSDYNQTPPPANNEKPLPNTPASTVSSLEAQERRELMYSFNEALKAGRISYSHYLMQAPKFGLKINKKTQLTTTSTTEYDDTDKIEELKADKLTADKNLNTPVDERAMILSQHKTQSRSKETPASRSSYENFPVLEFENKLPSPLKKLYDKPRVKQVMVGSQLPERFFDRKSKQIKEELGALYLMFDHSGKKNKATNGDVGSHQSHRSKKKKEVKNGKTKNDREEIIQINVKNLVKEVDLKEVDVKNKENRHCQVVGEEQQTKNSNQVNSKLSTSQGNSNSKKIKSSRRIIEGSDNNDDQLKKPRKAKKSEAIERVVEGEYNEKERGDQNRQQEKNSAIEKKIEPTVENDQTTKEVENQALETKDQTTKADGEKDEEQAKKSFGTAIKNVYERRSKPSVKTLEIETPATAPIQYTTNMTQTGLELLQKQENNTKAASSNQDSPRSPLGYFTGKEAKISTHKVVFVSPAISGRN